MTPHDLTKLADAITHLKRATADLADAIHTHTHHQPHPPRTTDEPDTTHEWDTNTP